MTSASPVTAVLDDGGRVLAADDAFADLVGPGTEQLVGSPFVERLTSEHQAPFRRALATSTGAGPLDLAGLRVDGLPWCARLALWPDPARTGEAVIATGWRRFGPVRWSTDRNEPSAPRPGASVDSVISHDIRGALRSATGFVTVAQRTLATPAIGGLDERVAQAGGHLDIAARSLANADELADGVVRLLRWADEPFSLRPLDLGDVITAATARSHEDFDGAAAEVRVDGALPAVLADEEHLIWAVAEIITNARKFQRPPGDDRPSTRAARAATVAFSPAADDDERFVTVAARDAGIGVAVALQDDAFLPGRKLQPRGDYPGVGIGLALCRLVFERHAGGCRIGGSDGSGTVVQLRLPSPPLELVRPREPRQ